MKTSDLSVLTDKACGIEAERKHNFSGYSKEARSAFPSPRKDRSTGVWYYECLDCGRQVYLIGSQIMGTAINGGQCERGIS